jgi:adenylosuccinate lyase
MRANLDITHGLILGEAAMLELGRRIGRLQAHHLVEQARAARWRKTPRCVSRWPARWPKIRITRDCSTTPRSTA